MPQLLKSFVVALLAACALAVVPSATALGTTHAFPSSNSTVVGSVGFIDDDEVGFFWSAARGDLVSETFTGPVKALGIRLRLEVVRNVLNNGAQVDWDVEVNGNLVGNFTVGEGVLGFIVANYNFPAITGPMYEVTLRVTNQVPGGQGSHTFAYAGAFAHSVELLGVTCSDRRLGVPCVFNP